MTELEPLAPGAVVVYYGSLPEQYGTHTIIGPCRYCDRCDEVFDQMWDQWYWNLTRRDQERARELFDRQFGHLFPRYELEGENGERLLCVRRSSLTPTDPIANRSDA
ncbi:hypothetical protein FAF44_02585 [Nonomuraea sp. MG754425]|uniref:hypothetical protein n=1 Tax=Nonomuraea sp. MG754425 TaxID=2570319 RepID=UPI001F1FAD7B|nr:hypothetical protein [Nonomuraea sp. MG754425]MCF6467300.1 hypothetical protein [Nonomuraea sp. MG754425]